MNPTKIIPRAAFVLALAAAAFGLLPRGKSGAATAARASSPAIQAAYLVVLMWPPPRRPGLPAAA